MITYKKEKSLILNNDNEQERMLFESCQMKGKRVVNPIIDWKTEDIWDYAQSEHISMNPLYQCGFSRVGCVGCPLAHKARTMEFEMFPKFKSNYIKAFERMLDARKEKKVKTEWETGVDVFNWWMENGVLPGQEYMPGFGEV